MGSHIVDGEFQSDKYPTCPPGKVPLSVKDATAQDLLWEYAQRRRAVDMEFADDLQFALRAAGYVPPVAICFACRPSFVGTTVGTSPKAPPEPPVCFQCGGDCVNGHWVVTPEDR
jgi:hypothetical protein